MRKFNSSLIVWVILCGLGLSRGGEAAERAAVAGKKSKAAPAQRRTASEEPQEAGVLTPEEEEWVRKANQAAEKDRKLPPASARMQDKAQSSFNEDLVRDEEVDQLAAVARALPYEQVRVLRLIAERFRRPAAVH